ncbi:Diacylglycerol acyltransferase [Fragilaria crotonensis]|nr:Diacylglycerol acyltransferase [Fragilaria crotonensis]
MSENSKSVWRWFHGMLLASIFSVVYIVSPMYMLVSLLSFIVLPIRTSILLSLPIIVSALIPSKGAPKLVGYLAPMLDYFDYEESFEESYDKIRERLKTGRRFILAFQPHGVISFVAICAATNAPEDLRALQTAVASALLHTPILKHVMGIFGLVDASKESLQRHFKKPGIHGCVALYVGGIAELFKSSRSEERIFLSKRKGFIKLALRENVDICPAYLFGNTSVLTIFKYGPLASLSRRTGVALTYFFGKWYLPIPRNEKLLYVRGKPMDLPHIPDPSQEDVDKWHAKYCEEVRRLFENNKEKVPLYKHKTLFID